jgi:hypothetical protein
VWYGGAGGVAAVEDKCILGSAEFRVPMEDPNREVAGDGIEFLALELHEGP